MHANEKKKFQITSPLLLLLGVFKKYSFYTDYTHFSQGSDITNFIGRVQNVAPYNLVVFLLVMIPKSDFLLIEAGTKTPKRSMSCFLSKIMNNKVLLESTNNLSSIFVRHIHFKKHEISLNIENREIY